MSNLYVIGNGFGLFHGLKTSYADFNEHLNSNEIYFGYTAEIFDFSVNEEGLWKDFENDLGSFYVDSYFDYHNEVDVTREDFRPSEVYELEDELTNQLSESNEVRSLREEDITLEHSKMQYELRETGFKGNRLDQSFKFNHGGEIKLAGSFSLKYKIQK